jgi:hypothetical protein
MIVHRITVRYQVGGVEEAVNLLKEMLTRADFPHAVRLYRPRFGVTDMTIGEFEFESLAQMEQFWRDWEMQPEMQAFWEKYRHLIEPGMVHDILDVMLEIEK